MFFMNDFFSSASFSFDSSRPRCHEAVPAATVDMCATSLLALFVVCVLSVDGVGGVV
jgi:hypothetical protein